MAHDYSIITKESELMELASELSKCPQHEAMSPLVMDVETHPGYEGCEANDRFTNQITGISISWAEDKAAYIPLAHQDGNNLTFNRIVQDPLQELFNILRPFATAWDWSNHVARYDWGVLKRYGLEVNYKWCTYVLAFVSGDFADVFRGEQGGTDVGLKSLVLRIFGYQMRTLEEIAKFADGYHPERVTAETMAWYACDDANYCRKFHQYILPVVQKKYAPSEMFIPNLELALSPIVEIMETTGLPFDEEESNIQLKQIVEFFPKARDIIYSQVERQLGYRIEFDINSPAQVADVLFDKLGLPVGRRSKKTNKPSTAEKAMMHLSKDFDIVHNCLTAKKVLKAQSGGSVTLSNFIHPVTKRIHSTFHQGGVPGGRFANSNPNTQNLSAHHVYVIKDQGQELQLVLNTRNTIKCEDDELFAFFDYKQQELWIAAEQSGEKQLLDKMEQGIDGHVATASLIYHVPVDQVTPELRKKGKTRNFAMIYQETVQGFAQKEGISIDQAQQDFQEYWRVLAILAAHRNHVVAFARSNFFIKTYFGRWISAAQFYEHPDRLVRDKGDRFAYNQVCQGTGADIAKIGMYRAHHKILHKFNITPVFHNGHDATGFWFKLKDVKDLADFIYSIKEVMEFRIPASKDSVVRQLHYGAANGFRLGARVDIKVGQRYGTLIDYKGQSAIQVIEELNKKKVQKEVAASDSSEKLKLIVDGQVTNEQMVALKALLVNNPGGNLVNMVSNGESFWIAKYPTSLSVKDSAKFNMVLPCKVVLDDMDLNLNVIGDALRR